MAGDGFEAVAKVGQKVRKGDLLGRFDSVRIASAGLDDTTMVIVTNTADYAKVTLHDSEALTTGQEIITVK